MASAGPSRSAIRKWRPGTVLGVRSKHPSVVVVAARNSGKSVTVRAIFEPLLERPPAKGGYDYVFVISRSAPTLDDYAEWVPLEYSVATGRGRRTVQRPDPFVNLRDRPRFIEALTAWVATKVAERPPGSAKPRTLVILDDFLEIGQTRYNAALSALYTEGRHLGITVVTLTQSLSELSTATRKNSTVVLCGQLTSGREIKDFCDQYLAFCIEPDPADWPELPRAPGAPAKAKPTRQREYLLALFRRCTTHNRYGFIVVDFDKKALFSEAVYWFKADL